jgi:hypothetical protein
MVSGKNIPSSFELENIMVTSSIKAMDSGKGKPSTSEIEDVRVTSPTEITALPVIPRRSITSEEDKNPDYDSPPDGGLFAWMQVMGGWFLVLNSR